MPAIATDIVITVSANSFTKKLFIDQCSFTSMRIGAVRELERLEYARFQLSFAEALTHALAVCNQVPGCPLK